MDHATCQCLQFANLNGITDVLLIYDIMCQYHVHFYERVAASINMPLLETLKIIKAIGQFHVHGHQEACLYRFSTMFIPGVGIVDGEILETLWSILNGISRSTRTASLAHRMEVLDDHMGDSNWKKVIGSSESCISEHPDVINRFLSKYDYAKVSSSNDRKHCKS